MPDLKAPSASGPGGGRDAPPADPLSSLYWMSTTAGVATQEYVAINNIAILAFLLGVASLLALIAPILLVIPLVALVCGLVAWSQIRRSNGTQSGTALAVLGLLLALGTAGFVVVHKATQSMRTRADSRSIETLVRQMGEYVSGGRYGDAYALFSPAFRKRLDGPTFESRWRAMQQFAGHSVVGMSSNGNFQFEPVADSDDLLALTKAVLRFQGVDEPSRYLVKLFKTSGRWYVEDVPELFPAPPPSMKGAPSPGATPNSQ